MRYHFDSKKPYTSVIYSNEGKRTVMKTQEASYTQVKNRTYFVGSINKDGEFSMAPNPVSHNTPELAQAECDRLAALYPGKAFFFAKFGGRSIRRNYQTILSLVRLMVGPRLYTAQTAVRFCHEAPNYTVNLPR